MNDTPQKKGFGPPSYGTFSAPLRCQCSVFPVQKSTTKQPKSSFGGVQQFSGERVLWYVFLPPYVLHRPISRPNSCSKMRDVVAIAFLRFELQLKNYQRLLRFCCRCEQGSNRKLRDTELRGKSRGFSSAISSHEPGKIIPHRHIPAQTTPQTKTATSQTKARK